MVKKVWTYGDLRNVYEMYADTPPVLVCFECGDGGEYSANPADYWMVPDFEEIKCVMGHSMQVVLKTLEYKEIFPPEDR